MTFKEYETMEDFHSCNIWDWAVEHIVNPLLADMFVWDACRVYKFNGKKFIRIFHEPWTAERFYEVQVC